MKKKPLSGYASEDAFIATRKRMGGRWVIHIDMSISQLVLGVEAPPVGVPQEDNREVQLARCNAFRDYVDENPHWGCSSLMLWCPEGTVRFEPIDEINDLISPGVQVGILHVPRNSRLSIRILDGQHRIKGFHLWVEKVNTGMGKARDHLARARENGDLDLIEEAKIRVKAANASLARIEKEYVGVDLAEVNTAKEAKQVFADIANNAKGMTKALTTGFDTSKIVNRVTQAIVLESPHPVLDGRVEWNKDRLSGSNANLLSAKTVADIVRATLVGVVGRVSRVQERTLDDATVEHPVRTFFDAIEDAFPQVMSQSPQELREKSLIASGTTLRVLAGAWHVLTNTTSTTGKPVKPLMSHEEVTSFFKRLSPHMDAPVLAGNPWLTTGNFPAVPDDKSSGVMAPSSRTQDLKGLTESLVRWATGEEPMPF